MRRAEEKMIKKVESDKKRNDAQIKRETTPSEDSESEEVAVGVQQHHVLCSICGTTRRRVAVDGL